MVKHAVSRTAGKETKSQISGFNRRIHAICLASGIGLFLVLSGLWLYGWLFTNKVLYGVALSGIPYGGMNAASLTATLKQQADRYAQSPLLRTTNQQTATLEDVGIELDVPATVQAVLLAGKAHASWDIWSIVRSIVAPPSGEWQIHGDASTASRLAALDPSLTAEPKDAYWKLADGELTVIPEELGRQVDVAATLTALEEDLNAGTPQPLAIRSSSVTPKRVAAHLVPLTARADQLIHQSVTLTAQKGRFTVPTEELLTWLDVQDRLLVLNETAVLQSLDTRARNVERSPKVRQISSVDQTVLAPGQEGITLDRESSVLAIKQSWFAGDQAEKQELSIALATKAVAPAQQVVNPTQPSTPGLFAGKYIEVDLSSQTLFQFEGQQLVGTHRVSTGKWSMPTPIGTFTINNKAPRAYSAKYGLYMPQWMAFLGSKYGLHSLPEWPDGTREGESHLGIPVSHGCVRLGREESVVVYNWAEVGTPVVIHR